jgi:TolB-like protein/Flp pilus assembly protein TadD
MTNSGTVNHARAALAAYEDGKKTLAELETVLAAALQDGLLTPAVAMDVLEKPVAAGVVPADTLIRLGLSKVSDGTVLRSPEPSSKSGRPAAGHRAPSDSQPIATGQLLAGRYRLERKLGEGGMGVVYLASDQEVKGEIFAIKVLTPEIRERPDALELLREEVRKTRALAHPNIVGVYSLNVDRSDVFILMECLEGKTLQALLDEDFGRGMPFDRAWPIIADVGAALAYAHDHSVIHGDLKPANVFVTTSGKAKLLDFGIARAARGPRRAKDAAVLSALTPAYASCEMLEGVAPDPRDDIYAFACMIYEMLSGRHPFGGRNAVQARDAGEKPPPIISLSRRQNSALTQALSFDRAARTATVERLLAGLAPGAGSGKRRVRPKAAWFAALLVAGAVTLAYFVVDKFWLSKHVTSEKSPTAAANVVNDKSIAVLPFADMSEKKDQEYFADGMAEEILDLLAKIPAIKVIGRTSSFQFKGKNTDLRTIGRDLGVAYVLEGSVRKADNRVRITAQLIGTQDGVHRWSESYDRDVIDVLKLQDEIAGGIARALQITVGATDLQPRPTLPNPEAYDVYLQGKFAFDRADDDGFVEAADHFQQAIEIDPTFADAAAWLAYTKMMQAEWEAVVPGAAFEQGRRAAEMALRLNPNLALAHVALAEMHLVYDWDWEGAEKELKHALTLQPRDALALLESAELAESLGHMDEAVRLMNDSLAVDPYSPLAQLDLGYLRWHSGHLAEAGAALRRCLQISPSFAGAHYYLAMVLLTRNELDAALTEVQLETNEVSKLQGLALVYFGMGRTADANQALEAFTNKFANIAAFPIAEVRGFRRENDLAFTWLDRAYTQKDSSLFAIKGHPLLKSLEGDPRYKAFLRKMKLPE